MQTADPDRFKFAFPGVMEGNLTGCSWETNQPCTAPMKGSDCYAVKCDSIEYSCPPSGQEACPGFTGTSCDKVPGTSKPYWMHKCNPLALPTPERVTMLTCNATADEDDSFQCYFSQVLLPVNTLFVWVSCSSLQLGHCQDTSLHSRDHMRSQQQHACMHSCTSEPLHIFLARKNNSLQLKTHDRFAMRCRREVCRKQ